MGPGAKGGICCERGEDKAREAKNKAYEKAKKGDTADAEDKKEGEVSDASTDDVLVRAAKKHAHLMHALPAQRANNVEITVRKLKIDDRHIKVRQLNCSVIPLPS